MTGIEYPETKKVEVEDDYHGHLVKDPFRWLEDTDSPDTQRWISDQNALTNQYLSDIPDRDSIRDRLEKLWNYERFGIPTKRGGSYFFSHNDGLQNQSILYRSTTLDSKRMVLLDPNQLSDDGTVALAGYSATKDGRFLAYGIADGGSDWRTWKVRDVSTGKDLEDTVEWVKFSGISWKPDGSGFFYGRYAEPIEGQELIGTNENQKLFFHRLGDSQQQDELIYERPDQPKWGFSPQVTDDGRFLILENWKGSEPQSQVFIKDLSDSTNSVKPLITGFDAEYIFVGSKEDELYFLTDQKAPKRRLISLSAEDVDRSTWQEVIPEGENVLESVSLFGESFYCQRLANASSEVVVHDLSGREKGGVELPGLGSVGGFVGPQDAEETFFSFTNYVTPTAIYRVDLATGATALWRQPRIDLDRDAFVTEQIFATSKDGTKVPVMITRRRETRLDGKTRTLLYGYGGFNISITPYFSPATAAWVDSGGIYAVANLRGGGEFGRQWHEAGMRHQKQNVFDDCIASAEYLIEKGYTTKDRLALQGRSNGGLLVGAVMTQRPDLFGACLPAVGVMDMLRYQKFTIGWAWVAEYGSSDEPDQIANLLSYSPLHNLKPNTCYPATLVTTAERDDRVVPGHSFKFAAALQESQACASPVLIRVETRAGHGAGTPTSMRIDEYADLWSFLMANLQGE
ncbi:MAG: prolyl oligopeptidase family serine peptidase [Planctomycetota bacterium]|nr:prolyl oligopeptidase family serine peptidase [Planctomycetota bacterium]